MDSAPPIPRSAVTLVGRTVLKVKFDKISSGWEQWVMVSADRHHDNIHTRWDIEKRHLELAKERGALIIDVGDLFCAMQGKYDPRSSMEDIRPEHVGIDYLDRLTKTAAKFYAPYAGNFLLISQGNHETNVLKRHGTDLTSNLVSKLRSDYGASLLHNGLYGGWVKFQFASNGTRRQSINLKYHHGAGGGGPVTKGVIQTNRQAVYLPDAHIVVNGHTHDQWVVNLGRERLSSFGKVSRDILTFIRTGTYKDEYNDGGDGFHIERWGEPKPLGCVWLRFYFQSDMIRVDCTPMME